MKIQLIYTLLLLTTITSFAQNKTSGEQRTTVVKTENGWSKNENEPNQNNSVQVISDGITLTTKPNGISITIPKTVANLKLFALTGEVVWTGNLVQGKFFIPTQTGIYFLRINNKSYKIICK